MANKNDGMRRVELRIEELQNEIIAMQNQVAKRAGFTQGLILAMTLVAFIIGVFLLVIAVAQVLLKGDFVFGAFSSGGGIAAVIGTLLYNPMKKAQQSMGDLAQIQVAFLSFNSKVSIWIEFVKEKVPSGGIQVEKVKNITADIEKAAGRALEQIRKYCEDQETEKKGSK